jgi:hypothetical protein
MAKRPLPIKPPPRVGTGGPRSPVANPSNMATVLPIKPGKRYPKL